MPSTLAVRRIFHLAHSEGIAIVRERVVGMIDAHLRPDNRHHMEVAPRVEVARPLRKAPAAAAWIRQVDKMQRCPWPLIRHDVMIELTSCEVSNRLAVDATGRGIETDQ